MRSIIDAIRRMLQRLVGSTRLTGRLRVWRDGELILDTPNKVVNAGLDALVDALVAAAYVNTFRYIGFGTNNTATLATSTALGAEVSGGTYARLTATQGEGDNTREYRLSGTWTNTSGATRTITEYGIFSAASAGTMLARTCVADGGAGDPTESFVVNNGSSITVQWDIQLADA